MGRGTPSPSPAKDNLPKKQEVARVTLVSPLGPKDWAVAEPNYPSGKNAGGLLEAACVEAGAWAVLCETLARSGSGAFCGCLLS